MFVGRSQTTRMWKKDVISSSQPPTIVKFYVYLEHISEKAMAPHSSTLAWKIPWTEEPGRLQSLGSLRVRHNWATSLSLFTFMHWRRKWQPTPVFLPGESQGQRSLVGCHLWGRTELDTMKWLSSSSRTYLVYLLCLPVCFLSSLESNFYNGRDHACLVYSFSVGALTFYYMKAKKWCVS